MKEMKINISDNPTDLHKRAKELAFAARLETEADFNNTVKLIEEALADERRRVWEEAAKICDERAKYYRSIKSVGDIHDRVVGRLADEIRAKAHAGQEG